MTRQTQYEPSRPPASSSARKKRPGVARAVVTALYLLCLVAITLGNLLGPEEWWFGSLNLYLPQWIWALPGLVLVPWYGVSARRRLWVPLLALLWVAGPLMGFCWPWPGGRSAGRGLRLRVMTYNVKQGRRSARAIIEEIARTRPDLILMQDASSVLNGPLDTAMKDLNVRLVDQYVIASRYTLSEPEVRWTYPEGIHRCIRCTVDVGGQSVVVYDAHLMSPRDGLVAIRHPRSQGGVARLEENVDVRLRQAARLAEYLRAERGPLILTGDLNAPIQSLACQSIRETGLRDAFSVAGRGYGYTYGQTTRVGRPYVRIDHIFASPDWQVQACWVGNSEGSDHSPVIADLFLPAK